MQDLMEHGMDVDMAYKIMQNVRKGRGLKPEMEMAMHGVGMPGWYINACKIIKYLFPRAHAVAYLLPALRIAWFKVHHPRVFYITALRYHMEDLEPTDFQLDEVQLRRGILASRSQPDLDFDTSFEYYLNGIHKPEHEYVLLLLLEAKKRGIAITAEDIYGKESI